MESITKNNLTTMEACRYCPMCRQSCPSEFISYRESDTPRGRAMLLHGVYKGGKEFDGSTIQAIYNCFVCGACKSWCEGYDLGGYDIPELIRFARRDIVSKGLAPEAVEVMKVSLLEKDNARNLDKQSAFTATAEEIKADILYYLGEEVNYKNHEIAEAVTGILKKSGVSYTLLKDEPSGGKILDLLGYREEAKEKAKVLLGRIKATGCTTLLVSDPLAYDAFKNDYPEWGLDLGEGLTIVHVSEYFSGQIQSGKLKLKKTNARVTLADSEYLGRFNEVYEAPREVIRASAGDYYAEMQWHHGYLQSTGEAAFTFDGEVFNRGDELGKKISVKAREVKAGIIITLSATAKNNIGSNNDLKVMDIAEFVAELMV